MPSPKEYPIKIALRIRPRNKREVDHKQETIVKKVADHKARLQAKSQGRMTDKTYSYDHVFGPDAGQLDVYEAVVAPCINEVLQGFNCTVFAYGQTGTGKTHTMEGIRSDKVHESYKDDRDSGLIPRALHHLFEVLESQPGTEFSVRVSFLEIYNEDIFDLLGSDIDFQAQKKLAMYEDKERKGSVIIKGLEEVIVRNRADVYGILSKGAARRSTAETKMNKQSSRSHSVFSCTVHQKESTVDGEELVKTGKMYLVDLAGAENIGRSGAQNARAREAGNINQSLLTLGRVISKLVERAGHIPYRESKLTRLLQDSLGGRTKTSIIATISPANGNLEETLSTMDYALRAKSILNRPEANAKLTKKAVLTEFTKEIEQLKRDLAAAREKNGVFLSAERHQEMTEALSSQKTDIEELTATLSARCDELEKIQGLFQTTEAELKATATTLSETKVVLEQTEQERKKAKEDKIIAEAERDETKYVLQETQTTEQTLHRQATGLVEVAQTTTAHVDALHGKVSRTKAATEANHHVANTAKSMILDGIAKASTQAEEFAGEQTKLFDSMKNDFSIAVDHMTKQVTAMQAQLGDMQAASTITACNVYAKATASKAVMNGMLDVRIKANRDNAASLIDHANEFANSEFPIAEESLREQIDGHAKIIASFTKEVESQFTAMQQRMDAFTTEMSTALSDLKEAASTQFEEQAAEFEAREAELTSVVASRNKENHQSITKVKDDITSLLDSYFAEQSSRLEADVGLVRTKCKSAASATRSHASTFQAAIDTHTDSVTTFASEARQLVESDISDVQSTASKSMKQTQGVLDALTSIGKDVVVHQTAMSAGIIQVMQHSDETTHAYRQQHNDYASAVVTLASAEATNVSAACAEIDTSAHATGTALAKFGCDATESIDHLSSCSLAHVEESATHLRNIADGVAKHIDSGLQVVVPTGETPMRQVYSFETKLPQTAASEILIERYRTEVSMAPLSEEGGDIVAEAAPAPPVAIKTPATTPIKTPNKSQPRGVMTPRESKLPSVKVKKSPFLKGSSRNSRKVRKPLGAAN